MILRLILLVFTATALSSASAQPNAGLAARLQERLDEFHRSTPNNGEKLRVVYFHPADRDPQKNFQDRLTRILFDIREFLGTEMRRNGFRTAELPLEIVDGELEIHVVRGAETHHGYEYGSSGKIRPELERALEGKVDFANDFVLVFGGLCEKRDDGSYLIHSPYYGDGSSNQVRGLCWAADGEMLDPRNFSDTETRIRYREHLGQFEKSMAAFNSLYLGGITHELGHGLSLPHNGEWPDEARIFGKALMGSGNHTYRNDHWNKNGKGTFLTLATSLRLAAHPLFTGSDRGRSTLPSATIPDLTFQSERARLTVRGRIDSNLSPVGIIASCNPGGGTSYDARTWVSETGEDATFRIDIDRHVPGPNQLELIVVHANGATATPLTLTYRADPSGLPDAAAITTRITTRPFEEQFLAGDPAAAAKSARAFLKKHPTSPAATRLEALIALTDPPPPIDLARVAGKSAILSDAAPREAKVGWGRPTRNQFYPPAKSNTDLFLDVGGKFFEKGLYAHAPSRHVFDLAGKWKQFQTEVGLQAGSYSKDGALFTVIGDGKTLHTTKALKNLNTATISVDITGIQTLELITAPAGKQNNACWSIWAAPVLSR